MPSSRSSRPKHARLSPSKSHTWLKCRASVGYVEKNAHRIPKEKPSPHAAEGSLAHAYAEHLLLNRKKWEGPTISAEMAENVRGYADYVRMQAKTIDDAKLLVEQRVPLFYYPEEDGTVDAALVTPRSCFVFDLKYGEGVSVEAQGNPQLAIYFVSLVRKHGIKLSATAKVTLVIYQPRAADLRFVRKWETTWSTLQAFARSIEDAAHDIILDPHNQPFHAEADTVCRWCPAKPFCTHYAAHLLGEAPPEVAQEAGVPEVLESALPVASTLSLEQVGKIVRAKRDIIAWLEKVEDYAMALEGDGTDVPGVKLVTGKGGGRQWSAPDAEVAKFLRPFVPEKLLWSLPTLISPAQVEKLLKHKKLPARFKDRFAQIITKPAGRPTLVVDEDPRPALDVNPCESLENLEDLNSLTLESLL